ALSARQQLVAQVAAAERSLRAAEDVERMYQVRYQAGASDLRTWLDAQQSRRDAELAFAQARLGQLVNDGVLVLALGGSWGGRPAGRGPVDVSISAMLNKESLFIPAARFVPQRTHEGA